MRSIQKHHWMLQCKQRMFYQTSTALFRSAAHSRPLCKKNLNIRRSISKIYSSHCGAPCQWNFLLVQEVRDSVLQFRFLHCQYTCRTVGEESTSAESTTDNVVHVLGFGRHRGDALFAADACWNELALQKVARQYSWLSTGQKHLTPFPRMA